MQKILGKYLTAKMLVILAAVGAMGAFAAGNPAPLGRQNVGRPQIAVVIDGSLNRNGVVESLEKVDSVRIGEVIDWTVSSRNEGDGDATRYRVVGQIPAGTIYITESAEGEGSPAVTFSIDGGKSFATTPLIDEKQADGSFKKVPAPASLYTQVRFEWSAPLGAQETRVARYQVRVR